MILGKDVLDLFEQAELLSEENIRNLYGFVSFWPEKDKCVEFFSYLVSIKPDSYEARRGVAENLMLVREFAESARQWEIIISDIGTGSIGVRVQLFRCYQELDSPSDMERVYEDLVKIAPEHERTIAVKDVLLSYLNAHYEVSLSYKSGDGDLPVWLQGLNTKIRIKCKENVNITIPKHIVNETPYMYLKYKNGTNVKLYPLITTDKLIYNIEYLTNVSNLFMYASGKKYEVDISRKKILGVIEGKDEWLFLDNDSNQSVEQFIGARIISKSVIEEWKYYLDYVKRMPNVILLVPPSKESVFPQFYPFAKADRRSIDQLCELVEKANFTRFLYPVDLLRSNLLNYSKTETHYSYEGARVVFEELAKKYFNINPSEHLHKKLGPFIVRKNIGDLGSKMVPERKSDFVCLQDTHRAEYLAFDNNIRNTGKVEFYINEKDAIADKKVLILGDSFSEHIAPYFYACFSKVMICRTVGSIRMDLIYKFNPDYIVLELTERFIIKAPVVITSDNAIKYPLEYDEEIFTN